MPRPRPDRHLRHQRSQRPRQTMITTALPSSARPSVPWINLRPCPASGSSFAMESANDRRSENQPIGSLLPASPPEPAPPTGQPLGRRSKRHRRPAVSFGEAVEQVQVRSRVRREPCRYTVPQQPRPRRCRQGACRTPDAFARQPADPYRLSQARRRHPRRITGELLTLPATTRTAAPSLSAL